VGIDEIIDVALLGTPTEAARPPVPSSTDVAPLGAAVLVAAAAEAQVAAKITAAEAATATVFLIFERLSLSEIVMTRSPFGGYVPRTVRGERWFPRVVIESLVSRTEARTAKGELEPAAMWGGQGSNLRPEDYESPALTN
jgi:hypothetical protein